MKTLYKIFAGEDYDKSTKKYTFKTDREGARQYQIWF